MEEQVPPQDISRPIFKTCGFCRHQWPDWEQFIFDPGIKPLGLQAITSMPDANLFMFEHRCGSTVTIRAKLLRHLLPEPESDPGLLLLFEKDHCEGHCRFVSDLESCSQPCANARDRRLLLWLLDLKQRRDAQP
jgi:hypothetical protein